MRVSWSRRDFQRSGGDSASDQESRGKGRHLATSVLDVVDFRFHFFCLVFQRNVFVITILDTKNVNQTE